MTRGRKGDATKRKSRLAVTPGEIASLVRATMGGDAAAAVRYGQRFVPAPHRVANGVSDQAWHPATQIDRPMRSGGDDRGSAEDRRRRKRYLLDTFGDGERVPCGFCRDLLTFDTLTVDRWPIPGRRGGRYTRDNIRAACVPCNTGDQGRAAMLALDEGSEAI